MSRTGSSCLWRTDLIIFSFENTEVFFFKIQNNNTDIIIRLLLFISTLSSSALYKSINIRNKKSFFKYREVIIMVGRDQIYQTAIRVLLDLITPRPKLSPF